MNNDYINMLKETLSDASKITPEKVKVLVDETVNMLTSLKTQMSSEDPEQRQKALDTSFELKRALDVQMQSICQMTGLDLSQINTMAQEMAKNPGNSEAFFEQLAAPRQESVMDPEKAKKTKLRLIG